MREIKIIASALIASVTLSACEAEDIEKFGPFDVASEGRQGELVTLLGTDPEEEGLEPDALAAESPAPAPIYESNKVQYGVPMGNGRYKFSIASHVVEITITTYLIGEGRQPAFGYATGPNNSPLYSEAVPPNNYITINYSQCANPYAPPKCKSLCCAWEETSQGRYLYREVVNGTVQVLLTTQPLILPVNFDE